MDINFEKIAVLDENKIEFTVNGERYEWVSGAPILPNGGSWYLWVLHDTELHAAVSFGNSACRRRRKERSERTRKARRDI